MKSISLTSVVDELFFEELTAVEQKIVKAAQEATVSSYSPYSKFMVGAAVLLSNNEIVKGSNQENVSYPEGTCAERCAIFAACSTYPRAVVKAIAIAAQDINGFTRNPITPCGACRQVLLEYENKGEFPITVLMFGTSKIYRVDSVESLLPLQFNM